MADQDRGKYIFYLGMGLWLLAAILKLVDQSTLLGLAGLLVLFVAVRNSWALYRYVKTGEPQVKLKRLIEQMGLRRGLIFYAVFFVGILWLCGGLMVFYGLILDWT